MTQPTIELITRRHCPKCEEVKKWLRSRDIVFTELIIDETITVEEVKDKWPEMMNLPICTVDGTFIGGQLEMLRWTVSYIKEQKGL